MTASADLSAPIYAALTGNSGIAGALAVYEGAPAVFTRSPAPSDATYPMILVNEVTGHDDDLLVDRIDEVVVDVRCYGQNDTPAHYRAVESIAFAVRDLFHRQRASLTVPGWLIMQIIAARPVAGPTDDDTTTARIVTLTIKLSEA